MLNGAKRNHSIPQKECFAVVRAVQTLLPYLEKECFTIYTDHHSFRWLMNVTKSNGRLARWQIRTSEFDYDIQYIKVAKNYLAVCMGRVLRDGAMTAQIDEGIPCFVDEPEDPDESLGDDEPVPVEICGLERMFHLKLSEDITSVAMTMHVLVREQNSDLFCRKVRLALQRGADLGQKRPKDIFFENKEGILCRKAHIGSVTKYLVLASLIERLLYVSPYSKTA